MKSALAVVALFVLTAQKPPAACPLLTPAELNAAVGTKVGPGQANEIVIPRGPAKGQTMTGCMWSVGQQGMVTISVIRAPSKEGRDAAIAQFHAMTERLEAKGWKHEDASTGGTRCGVLIPPKSEEKMPTSVGCMGEAKGLALSVSAMIKDTKVPPAKVKALYDAAVKRLP